MKSSRSGRSLLRTESYGTASVTWLDRRAADDAAVVAARRLARRHPEITGVLLFGSIARGDAGPASDIDLVLVLEASDHPFPDRVSQYAPEIDELPVEVFPYTEDEARELLSEPDSFLATALAEGRWLVGPSPALARILEIRP